MEKQEEKPKIATVDLATLSEVKKNLEEQIKQLEIRKNNLDAQLHTETVKREIDKKLEDTEKKKEFIQEADKLDNLRNQLNSRVTAIELLEEQQRSRIIELEKREMEMINIEEKRMDLNNERSNFNKYKYEIELELEKAKEIIAEANVSEEKIRMNNEALAGRERLVKDREKYWNDRIGELEEIEARVKREIENLEGLKKAKEVAGV